MGVFTLALIDIHDRERYRLYEDKAAEIFMREKVKVHAVDDAPYFLGDLKAGRVVLLEFNDKDHRKSFFELPDYIEAGKDRDAAANLRTIAFDRFTGQADFDK